MYKTPVVITALLALLFAPALWGLPPPGAQVPAELAWNQAANDADQANVAKMVIYEELTLGAVATERLATTPSTGGVRLLTFKSPFGSSSISAIGAQPERNQGPTWLPPGGL